LKFCENDRKKWLTKPGPEDDSSNNVDKKKRVAGATHKNSSHPEFTAAALFNLHQGKRAGTIRKNPCGYIRSSIYSRIALQRTKYRTESLFCSNKAM
jgi:hypothetical protein